MTEDTSPENIEKLIEEFKESCEDPYGDLASMVFSSATQKLIKIGEPAVESLIKALKTEHKVSSYSMADGHRDTHEDCILQEAAMALGEIGDVKAVPRLIELLEYVPYMDGGDEGDCYWDVALAGVIALGRIGDARAVEPLLELTHTYGEPHIDAPSRWMIEELVVGTMEPNGLGYVIGIEVHREVARALGDIGLKSDNLEIVTLGIGELLNYTDIRWDESISGGELCADLGIDRDVDVVDVCFT